MWGKKLEIFLWYRLLLLLALYSKFDGSKQTSTNDPKKSTILNFITTKIKFSQSLFFSDILSVPSLFTFAVFKILKRLQNSFAVSTKFFTWSLQSLLKFCIFH